MIFRLPFEILTEISSFMTNRDKLQCTRVCKAWTRPFQDSLWNILDLDYTKLANICSTCDLQNNVYQKNGYLVESLAVREFHKLNDQKLYTLQKTFGALRHLSFQQYSLGKQDFGKTADWNLWRSLTELDLFMPDVSLEIRREEMLKILGCLPRLTRLRIVETYMEEVGSYTWQMLESIHAILPRLRNLHTNIPMNRVQPGDIKYIKSITPASLITQLKLIDHNMDIGWLYYFSLKYPNIDSLYSQVKRCSGSYIERTTNPDEIRQVSSWSYNFSRLKTVTMEQRIKSSVDSDIFWKSLYQIVGSLDHFIYTVWFEDDISDLPQGEVSRSIGFSSNTLRSAHIVIKSKDDHQIGAQLKFGICPRLVKLEVGARHGVIQLDLLLRNCSSLKTFVLRGGSVKLNSESEVHAHKQQDYCLEEVSLWSSTVGTNVFEYISTHCKSLSNLSLSYIKVKRMPSDDSNDSDEKEVVLDMPHTGFNSLEFKFTHFSLNTDLYSTVERMALVNSSRDTVYLIVLELLGSISNSADISSTNVNVRKPQETRFSQPANGRMWIYYQPLVIGEEERRCLRQLGEDETEFVENHFGLSKSTEAEEMSEEIDSNLLKDLQLGFMRLRCKYIRDFRLDSQRLIRSLE
ncbi:hypothetical protein F4703DRAFT_1867147 [Phycomyces blakesleeanus]